MAYKPLESLKKAISNSEIDRRGFITASLEGIALLNLSGNLISCTDAKQDTEYVENFMKNFPNKIPGANRVLKYEVDGAKKCLLHINQLHLDIVPQKPTESAKEIQTESLKEVKAELVKKVHDEIYKILLYIVDNFNIKDVYNEGVVRGYENIEKKLGMLWHEITLFGDSIDKISNEKREKWYEHFSRKAKELRWDIYNFKSKILETLADKGYDKTKQHILKYYPGLRSIPLDPELVYLKFEENLYSIADNQKYDLTTFPKPISAPRRLSSEGKIRIKGTETLERNIDASIEMSKGKIVDAVTEDREDGLLKHIASTRERIATTVYGALHDFINNIASWNNADQKNKFSLIEINPSSLSLPVVDYWKGRRKDPFN